MSCPDQTTIDDWVCGDLSPEQDANEETHFLSCGRCAKRFDRLTGGEEIIADIRELERERDEYASALSRISETGQTLSETLFGAI